MTIRYHCRFGFSSSTQNPTPEPFETHTTFLPRVGDAIIHKGKRYYVYYVGYSFDLEATGDPFMIGLYDINEVPRV